MTAPRRPARFPAVVALGLACALTAVAAGAPESPAGGSAPKIVYVAPIEGMIDLGLAPFVQRVLEEAQQAGAAAVILEVNTFGGRVDAAVLIRDHLLRSSVPTVAFVNKRAISAGALISLAAETVVMAKGATIGAATPVQVSQPNEPAKPVEEKTVSYVRKEFRATADARKRPGTIAEAMVDADVEIAGLIEKGKLLTLTTAEALEHKVADHEADELGEVLAKLGLGGAEVRRASANWAERVVRFLTHPVVSSLLMTLAILGIVVELRTPGFGVPGLVGMLSLGAFFWGHWLVQLVGWEEVLLVTLGVLLLLVELFVLPGFGVAGVLGALAVLAGLTLSLFGAGASARTVVYAIARVAVSGVVAIAGSLVLLRFLPLLPMGRRLILAAALPGAERTAAAPERVRLVGVVGTALTPLRPAGIAELAGGRVDVVSEGDFIDPGQAVEVVLEAGSRVVVRPHRPKSTEGNT
jgi:membrane-bound serine protease (ClpP class)